MQPLPMGVTVFSRIFIDRIEDAYGKVIYQSNPEYACISCINQNDPELESAEPVTPDDEVIEVTNQTLQAEKELAQLQLDESESQYRQAQRILKSSSAYDIANILRDVIQQGTGRAALKIGRGDIGGKTGTTNDAKDAWFAGFNGKLVTVAWVGFDQPTTLGHREYGGVAALPIWTNFMGNALKGTPAAWVHFDKNAKAPTNHTQTITIGEPAREDRSSPPHWLAHCTALCQLHQYGHQNVTLTTCLEKKYRLQILQILQTRKSKTINRMHLNV